MHFRIVLDLCLLIRWYFCMKYITEYLCFHVIVLWRHNLSRFASPLLISRSKCRLKTVALEWKVKITKSYQSHHSYKQYQIENWANADPWTHHITCLGGVNNDKLLQTFKYPLAFHFEKCFNQENVTNQYGNWKCDHIRGYCAMCELYQGNIACVITSKFFVLYDDIIYNAQCWIAWPAIRMHSAWNLWRTL